MPLLFIGHGNPMNALADNAFTRKLEELGGSLPRPEAILCISAHWMTKGTWITANPTPKTIHDFSGFPGALFDIQYPAPSRPALAEEISKKITEPPIVLDHEMWGFDHGAWSVLRHMYPEADIPLLQLSLDLSKLPSYHFELGRKLGYLRDQGVLILGSGNLVHNLGLILWEPNAKPYDWAIEFDGWVKACLERGDYSKLQEEATTSDAGRLSIPTPDHWYPLFYVLGAADKTDHLRFEYEGIENGSISMRCLSLG